MVGLFNKSLYEPDVVTTDNVGLFMIVEFQSAWKLVRLFIKVFQSAWRIVGLLDYYNQLIYLNLKISYLKYLL